MTPSLQQLQAEAASLPGLITQAREQRDLRTVRKYKERLADLGELIEAATITMQEAAVAELQRELLALGLEGRQLEAELKQAHQAHQAAVTAITAAQREYNDNWVRCVSVMDKRDKLMAQVQAAKAKQQAAESGEALTTSGFMQREQLNMQPIAARREA